LRAAIGQRLKSSPGRLATATAVASLVVAADLALVRWNRIPVSTEGRGVLALLALAINLRLFLGEFGRTPKLGQVVSSAGATRNGRDHWPYCYTVLFAGAGTPAGAVYGASDQQGAYPSREPVTPEDIAATIYEALGIPPATEIRDPLDRPHLLSTGRPIRPLLG
jgi:hypothetical protein